MSEDEKIEMLSILLGDSEEESVMSAYLKIAGQKILTRAYPYDDSKTDVPDKYATDQCMIAAYLINKRGAEGQTTHTENGITRQYEAADVPESMFRHIVPHVGIIS